MSKPFHLQIHSAVYAKTEEHHYDRDSASISLQLIQALSQRFWTLWTKSYLHTLQTRSKWLSTSSPPQVGELVLIKEDNQPPLQWKLGRIIRTLPGKDGVIRVVDLDTKHGSLRRPVFKLARLPLDSAHEEVQPRPPQDVYVPPIAEEHHYDRDSASISLQCHRIVCLISAFVLRGFESPFLAPRVVGGVTVPDGRIPYQASLRTLFNSHFCGGSILNEKWVLTAAHCTVGQSHLTMQVVVGTNNLHIGGEHHSVESIIIHSDYNSMAISNDVSLVKVSNDIVFNDNVQSIQLPDDDTDVGADVMLSGWGRLSYPGVYPNHLQMLNLTSLSVELCQDIFVGINPVFSTQICAMTKVGEGACHGDSGGPLVEGNTVVGVVSWGMPCARGYPDVYSRVFAFKDWILEKMEQN
ncbi:chymotrypsin-2-like [Bombyx mandarina]|uniref:trypsin n=1 Tax=Bombyx mandarina TaxID=7092 RepID=A0A6J2JJJ2_BOMMA|nr:chymotrypsin-2-like [Bombyx mandarina]